jgi:hypothetical protein
MSTNDTFLAIFLANKTSPRMVAWNSLSEEVRRTKMQEGIAAWKAWAEKNHAAIVGMGGPLGKTKKVSERGIEDITNLMSAYSIEGALGRLLALGGGRRTCRPAHECADIAFRQLNDKALATHPIAQTLAKIDPSNQ